MTERCPACASTSWESFYRAGEVPVHSTLLMPTREAALGAVRRPLELAVCRQCGFIFNHLFEPGVHQYSGQCEETQSASPTFSKWLDKFIRRLVDEYGVRGQRVLEIGCGKGEFLLRLCAAGNNSGIGYDPAFVPGRIGGSAGLDIQFTQQLWTDKEGISDADLVVCRHTFEHIAPVAGFLASLRSCIGESATRLFFDVPDSGRILSEGAFWDVYYEHCSYFTASSLTGLFADAGFRVTEQWLDYQDQFLMILAEPGSQPKQRHFEPEGTLQQVAQFTRKVGSQENAWAELISAGSEESVVLWGGGSKATAFLGRIEGASRIRQVVDINPHKQGFYVPGSGQKVIAPADLRLNPPDHLVVMNPIYRDEVARQLSELGIKARIHCLQALES